MPPLDHDLCVLMGDLNSRTILSHESALRSVEAYRRRNRTIEKFSSDKGSRRPISRSRHAVRRSSLSGSLSNGPMWRPNELRMLMEADELLVAMNETDTHAAGQSIFSPFSEMPIQFCPTYKFDKGTNTYDTSKKKRVPSWADRVLYRGSGVVPIAYDSCPAVVASDHKPVSLLVNWMDPAGPLEPRCSLPALPRGISKIPTDESLCCALPRVFGVPLAEAPLVRDAVGRTVPTLLEKMRVELMRRTAEAPGHGLKSTGIFLTSPPENELVQLAAALDSMHQTGRAGVLELASTPKLAALLLLYLRKLPGDRWAAAQGAFKTEETKGDEQMLEQAAAFLKLLPPLERGLTLWVCELMAETLEHADNNKLTPAGLAECFGACLADEHVQDCDAAERGRLMLLLLNYQRLARL